MSFCFPFERFQCKEAGPQLLLQAFLQRIVNSGGRIEREYGLGRLRTDLLVLWPHPGGIQKSVIELKLLRRSLELTIAELAEDKLWDPLIPILLRIIDGARDRTLAEHPDLHYEGAAEIHVLLDQLAEGERKTENG